MMCLQMSHLAGIPDSGIPGFLQACLKSTFFITWIFKCEFSFSSEDMRVDNYRAGGEDSFILGYTPDILNQLTLDQFVNLYQ